MLQWSPHYNEFGKKRIESTKPVLSSSKYSLLSQFAVVLFSDHKQPERQFDHDLPDPLAVERPAAYFR